MTISSKTTQKVHVHAEGLVEICDLKKFRDTPKERVVLTQVLANLTQVKKSADGKPIFEIHKGVLFVELNLGDITPEALKTLGPVVKHRVAQKAQIALSQLVTRVK